MGKLGTRGVGVPVYCGTFFVIAVCCFVNSQARSSLHTDFTRPIVSAFRRLAPDCFDLLCEWEDRPQLPAYRHEDTRR